MSKIVASPVILIFGAGPRVGESVASIFAANGFKVAIAARRVKLGFDSTGRFNVPIDLSKPSSVAKVFEDVEKAIGLPSVVVCNAAASAPSPATDPLSLTISDFENDIAINTTSVLAAAHESVKAFEQLPNTASRTFIYTGNKMNVAPILPLLSGGMGKAATAHMLANASEAYKDKGFRFHYADQRFADGKAVYGKIDGPASAAFYLELALGSEQRPWAATFVKDTGYVEFPAREARA